MKQRIKRPLALLLTVVMLLGLLPTAAFAAPGDHPGAVGETKITSMILQNFSTFGVSETENVELLTQTEPLSWDVSKAYTLSFTVDLVNGTLDQSLCITLPYGMQFVGLAGADGSVNISSASIESVEWVRGTPVYEVYQRDNGTVTVHFKDSGWASSSFSLVVQPDIAFLPTEKRTEGFEIKNAIQAVIQVGEQTSEPVTVDAKLFTSNTVVSSNAGWNIRETVTAGSSITVSPRIYWQYFYPVGGGVTDRFIEKAELVFAVPKTLTVTAAYLDSDTAQTPPQQVTDISADISQKFPNCNFYSVSRERFYGSAQSLKLTVTIPESAQENEVYTITPVYSEVTSYNNASTNKFSSFTGETDKLQITVLDPDKVYLEVTASDVKLTNYTYLGNESQNFADYNMILSYVKIENKSVSEITGNLIYEAQFDESTDLIRTAIRIPCISNQNKYPTALTISYQTGTGTGSLSLTEEEIRAIAVPLNINNNGQGVEIRLADLKSLPPNARITGVQATIPPLSQSYTNCTGYQQTYTSGVLGRIAPGVTNNATDYTDQYRIYPAGTAEDDIPAYTGVTITVSDSAGILGGHSASQPTVLVNGGAATTANPGDTIQIKDIPVFPTDYYGAPKDMLAIDPILYVVEPEGLNLGAVSFSDGDGTPIYYTKTQVMPTNEATVAYGGRLWAYRLNNTLAGWFDGDMKGHKVYAEVTYTVPYGSQTSPYDVAELMFWGSGIQNTAFSGSFPYHADSYGLNNGKHMGGYRTSTFTVSAPSELTISSAIQIDGTDEWFQYDGTEDSLAVFGTGTQANVRVTIRNSSTEAVSDVEVYVPVPKQGLNLGEGFGTGEAYQFDMYVADVAEVADNWSVTYGEVTDSPKDLQTRPQAGQWTTNYNSNTSMVKITMSSDASLAPGESAEITLKLKATNEPEQSDTTNLFKSWWICTVSGGTNYDASENINFGALLQIGRLTGTVYADENRNSTMDPGEQGMAGVTVEVRDENNRAYEAVTGENGQYTIEGLPGNQQLTVTVYNPYSNENRAGAYRFSEKNTSTDSTVGSDVSSADSGRTATVTLDSLTGGTATVNAGLIQPYQVQFKLDRTSDTGYITPVELYVFQGQTLGDVTERVTVVTPAGQDFQDKWIRSTDSNTVLDSALLAQEVTADTTYTAQTSTRVSTVKATWQNADGGTVTKSWQVDFGDKVPSSGDNAFPTDTDVDVRPGYTFKGWEVNGDSDNLAQYNTIVNAAVYAGVNYVAHYEPKTDIQVTLKANGGTFGSSDTLTLSDLTYGGVVNNATGYAEPTQEGHYFAGWAEKEDATSGSQTLMVPTENKTYYAVWVEGEPAEVTVNFDRMGGQWTEQGASQFSVPLTGKPGTALTLPTESDITRTGYDFGGWYTDIDYTDEARETFPSASATWYVKWVPHKHTVTYDYNGGKVQGSDEEQEVMSDLDYDSKLADIPTPAKAGYELVGWEITTKDRTDTGYIIPVANMTERTVDGNITYQAYYVERPVTVTFHANGGQDSGAVFGDDSTEKIYQNVLGATMPFTDVPIPTREGYVFQGWVDKDGNLQSGALTFTANAEYYAKWEVATFTVTYRLNGGSTADAIEDVSSTVKYNGARPEAPAVTLDGNTLAYWLDMSTGKKYAAQADLEEGIEAFPTTAVTSDEVYLAIWNTNQYTVTFTHYDYSQEGAGYGDSSRREVPTIYNGTPAAPAVNPPTGQAFDYWRMTAPTEGIDGQKEFTAEALLELKVTQDMTFQAVFKATDYTVTFEANGGTFAGGTTPTYSVAYDQKLSTATGFTAPTVTKSGAVFLGWTKAGDSIVYTNGADDEHYIGDVLITGDTVFIASWSGDVRVTFNANGGAISGTDYAEGQTGETISNVPTPTRYGYDFGGWYTDSDCQTSAAESDGSYQFPNANATWYAGWTAKSVTVTFDYGEGSVGNEKQKEVPKPFGSTLTAQEIPAPVLAGSTLTGWSRADGTIIPNENMTSEVINNEDGVTYKAYYVANPITITFDPNGGAFPDGTTQAKSYMKSEGDTMPFADVPVPTQEAKTFAGWSTTQDGTAVTEDNMTFDTAKTYYAVWKDAEYTITFRLNGGSVKGSTDDVVESASHGGNFPTIPNVELSGNSLQGWMNMADGKMYGDGHNTFPTTVTESATYIAIWGTNTYNVTFTKYDYSDQSTGDISSLTIPTIYQGVPAAPTVTPPTGQQFTFWKIASGRLLGQSGTLGVNATITSAALTQCKVIEAVTLEAQYSDPTYTVTFNPGEDATLSGGNEYKVTNGKTMADMGFTVPTASKDGATSTTWICSVDGQAMTADQIKAMVIHSDVTFTAVWVGDVTVSFILNGGEITNSVPASVTGAPGTEVTVPLVEREGYTFEGWYNAETDGTLVTFQDGKTTIGDTSVTYYARWTQNTLTVEPTEQRTTYTGTPETLSWTVKDDKGTPLSADDYTVSYFNQETGMVSTEVPTNAGTYTVNFRGQGSYQSQTATAIYTIEQADLSAATVTVTDNTKTYNDAPQYATVTVTFHSAELVLGRDFTVEYSGGCVDAGDYSITVEGTGNFAGTVTPTEVLTIQQKTLADSMIQAIPPQGYTGDEIEPDITVHDGDTRLVEGTDYENVTYSNNVDVGNSTASVTITGKGNYTGTATAHFSIYAKETPLTVKADPNEATYGDDLSNMIITVKSGTTELEEGADYTLSYQIRGQDGWETVSGIQDAGVYLITATGTGNYQGSSGVDVFVLWPKDETYGTFIIDQENVKVTYDGADHLPQNFTVQWDDGSGTLMTLPESEYRLLYSYNGSIPAQEVTEDTEFVDVGVYEVLVDGTEGNYYGSASFVVVIVPKDIADRDVDVSIDETTYNAEEQTANITVTDGGSSLTENVDYTVSNAAYTDANEEGYEILITGTGNYTGTRTERFIIHRATITVTCDTVYSTYGDPLPDIGAVVVTANGIYPTDEAGVTVTLAWPSDLSAGEHELVANLSGDRAGNYVANTSGARLVISAKDMNGADSGVSASLNPNYGYYSGSPLTPNVVVTDRKLGTTLKQGTDYTVSYLDSDGNSISRLVELGSYTVVVTGKGNYSGTFELAYTIQNRPSGGGSTGGGGTTRYTIEAEAGRGGSISPDGRVRVDRGEDQTFRITPDEGFEIEDVIVDGKSVGAVKRYTFEDVRKSHTIEAVFIKADEPERWELPFIDVSADAYYHDAVQWAVEQGITSGTTAITFSPDASCTRAQMVTFLWRAAGSPTPRSSNTPFADVQPGAYYYDAVLWAVERGITSGTSATTFSPNATVTRGQTVTFLYRFAGSPAGATGTPFADVPTGAYYYGAILWAVDRGITAGTSATTFSPDSACSRGQIVTFLYRMMAD